MLTFEDKGKGRDQEWPALGLKFSKFADDLVLKRMLSGAQWISSVGFMTAGSHMFSLSDALVLQ